MVVIFPSVGRGFDVGLVVAWTSGGMAWTLIGMEDRDGSLMAIGVAWRIVTSG